MYPLIQIGPFRLSTGGLVLLGTTLLSGWLVAAIARRRGGAALADQADRCFYPVVVGALLGARLWYGLFNWDMYGRQPSLFWAVRISDFAWPGALLGGAVALALWTRLRGFDLPALVDVAALALPAAEALGSVGLLLSGEAFGTPTALPWGVALFGATRHPTQLYYGLAEVLMLGVLWRLAQHQSPPGTLGAVYLGLEGLTLLLIEAWRADSLVFPAGIRAAQVFGLALVTLALYWLRRQSSAASLERSAGTPMREQTENSASSVPG